MKKFNIIVTDVCVGIITINPLSTKYRKHILSKFLLAFFIVLFMLEFLFRERVFKGAINFLVMQYITGLHLCFFLRMITSGIDLITIISL